jgi:uncharacterized membrane protein YjjP (DUF1212 family)
VFLGISDKGTRNMLRKQIKRREEFSLLHKQLLHRQAGWSFYLLVVVIGTSCFASALLFFSGQDSAAAATTASGLTSGALVSCLKLYQDANKRWDDANDISHKEDDEHH